MSSTTSTKTSSSQTERKLKIAIIVGTNDNLRDNLFECLTTSVSSDLVNLPIQVITEDASKPPPVNNVVYLAVNVSREGIVKQLQDYLRRADIVINSVTGQSILSNALQEAVPSLESVVYMALQRSREDRREYSFRIQQNTITAPPDSDRIRAVQTIINALNKSTSEATSRSSSNSTMSKSLYRVDSSNFNETNIQDSPTNDEYEAQAQFVTNKTKRQVRSPNTENANGRHARRVTQPSSQQSGLARSFSSLPDGHSCANSTPTLLAPSSSSKRKRQDDEDIELGTNTRVDDGDPVPPRKRAKTEPTSIITRSMTKAILRRSSRIPKTRMMKNA